MNIYIFYEIHLWTFHVSKDFALENSLLGADNSTDNLDPDQYKYSGYDTGSDAR